MSASEELQDAIFDLLRASPTVAGPVKGRIYDNAPAMPEYPYISFGPSDFIPEHDDCLDQRDETFQIDVWVNEGGAKRPCRKLVDAVVKVLDGQDLILPNHSVVDMTVIMARVLDDPSRTIVHGVVQITCLIDS